MTDVWPDDPGDRPPLVPSTPWGGPPSGGGSVLAPSRPPGTGTGPSPYPGTTPGYGPPGRPPTPRAWIAAMAALATLLLVAVGALVWTNRDDETATPDPSRRTTTTTARSTPSPSTTRPAPTIPPSTAPASPPTTTLPAGPVPTQADVQAAVDALIPFVERTRGHTFSSKPAVTVVPTAEFDDQVYAAVDAAAEPLRQRALALQAFGVVDTRTDVAGVWRSVAAVGRHARYDTGTKQIAVRATTLTPYARGQLVAALTNALDDQRFGIARPQYDTEKDEVRWTFASVVVGDARRVTEAWVATLPDADRTAYGRAERQATSVFDPGQLPPALVPLLTSAPEVGSTFTNRLAAAGGPGVDQAFTEPPRTSTQLLHPERYLAREARVEVPKPQANGPELGDGVLGEAVTAGVLEESVPVAQAARAADGWSGDWFVLWRGQGGNPCIRVDYKARDGEQLEELHDAFVAWSEENPGAEINLRDDVLSVTRCAGGVSGRSPA